MGAASSGQDGAQPAGVPGAGGGSGWGSTFTPFGAAHAGAVGVSIGVMAVACWLGWRWRGTARGERLRVWLGWGALVYWLVSNAWYWTPGVFEWKRVLPLHICDLAGIAAGVALLTRRRWALAVLYFWGLGLSTQAFVTPIIHEGPSRPEFWFFWATHVWVVGGALYAVTALGYRPSWRDFGFMVLVTLAYGAAIVPFNIAFRMNYGYVGMTMPGQPTLIDVLGPWPWRLVPLGGLVFTAMALTVLPWDAARWATGGRRGRAPGEGTAARQSGAPGPGCGV